MDFSSTNASPKMKIIRGLQIKREIGQHSQKYKLGNQKPLKIRYRRKTRESY